MKYSGGRQSIQSSDCLGVVISFPPSSHGMQLPRLLSPAFHRPLSLRLLLSATVHFLPACSFPSLLMSHSLFVHLLPLLVTSSRLSRDSLVRPSTLPPRPTIPLPALHGTLPLLLLSARPAALLAAPSAAPSSLRRSGHIAPSCSTPSSWQANTRPSATE